MITKPTDFNDAMQLLGLAAIRAQLLAATPPTTTSVVVPGAGGKKKITEVHAARAVLRKWPDLMAQGDDLFIYRGTHWEPVTEKEIRKIKKGISILCLDALTSGQLDSYYKTFIRLCDVVPDGVNLFEARGNFGNFTDGTLTSTKQPNGTYIMHHRAHRRDDWITWLTPLPWLGDDQERNALLDDLIDEAHGKARDPNLDLVYEEMAGAILFPAFPHMFVSTGATGSRKSTISKLFLKLQDKKFVGKVDPADFKEFLLVGLLGKVVNSHMDIDSKRPFPDSFVKGKEDQEPVFINRKGKDPVTVYLPNIDVYCCNYLPPTFERSGAFKRRLTIIPHEKSVIDDTGAGVVRKFEDSVWDASPRGVLNWAKRGIYRLCANGGNYTVLAASVKAQEDWTESNDPVGLFVRAAKDGTAAGLDTRVTVGLTHRLPCNRAHLIFCDWYRHANDQRACPVGKHIFFKQLSEKYPIKADGDGTRYFDGIGSEWTH